MRVMANVTARLTAWEESQLQHIDLLLEQASETLKEFKLKDESLRSINVQDDGAKNTKDWLKFRGFTFDLYSVLDYTYFLLYSHFANKGVPDHSFQVASKCGFPYKRGGVKISDSDQDQSKKFISEKLNFLFADKIGECTHFWKDIGDIILRVQPKLLVGSDGKPVDEKGQLTDNNNPKIEGLDQTSYAILHYFRNCSTHRDLIHFLPEQSWVEINQTTREIKLVRDRQEREGFYYYTLEKGYWIHLPEDIVGKMDDRLLLEVLHQLFEFVKRITSKLLSSALLLSPRYILEHHFNGHLEVTSHNPVDGMYVVDVTMELHDNRRYPVISPQHKHQRDAEQDGYIKLLYNMAKDGILPTSPYTHLTPSFVQPSPCVSLGSAFQNYRVLKNEFNQKMALQNMQVDETNDPCPTNEKSQHYKTTFKLHVVDLRTHGNILKLSSCEHEEVGKDKVKETAVKEVIEECISLGIIELK